MAQTGPIILVDDDPDDVHFFEDALKDIGVSNNVRHFSDCREAFRYLKTTSESPFIIICDVNLPVQNGVEFKRQIDNDAQLRAKSIPFVFLSTYADKKAIDTAYKEMTVQGFFEKSSHFSQLKNVIKLIMDYWAICKHPNS